jgi:Ice-binding-like
MKHHLKRAALPALTCAVLVACALALVVTTHTQARTMAVTPPLGTASSFAVLGGQTVTNTGPTVLNGNLGVNPGGAITGFPPGLVHGATHKGDAVALQAQKDVKTAYNSAKGAPCAHDMTGVDLGGKTLVAGAFCFSSSAQLTGELTLSGPGVFIFQVGSTLTTASNASVLLIGGADPCDVFWQVGSSAAIGTDTHFTGNILALTSIAAQAGARFDGGLYARNGAVTLDNNIVSRASCTESTTPTPTTTPRGTPTTVPTKTPVVPPTKTPVPTITPEVGLG